MTGSNIDVINRLLRQPFGAERNSEGIARSANEFLACNKDPHAPPSYSREEAVDDMRLILEVVASDSQKKSPLLLLLLKVLKVLLRRPANRAALGWYGVQALRGCMASTCFDTIACECANVVLNMCYDSCNVKHFLEADGVSALATLIRSGNEDVQASGLGALQSVCFDKPGRDAARDGGVIGIVVSLLCADCPKVRARALGTLHNLSIDVQSIGIIRDKGALPQLVRLLRHDEARICREAAGTIQNLSREERSRVLLSSFGAVEPLADLLVGHHVMSQVAGAGALLNIVGPNVDVNHRNLLCSILADGIALGILESCLAC